MPPSSQATTTNSPPIVPISVLVVLTVRHCSAQTIGYDCAHTSLLPRPQLR
ncbi:hypothetical protein [Streptomyces heilongjiangensis]|uniref:Uncharacterized protein n=1 Tax=Streptomyces heilongjiangensis TaxID=945052 RepID=A0ABW1B328_9ACTN|nr:hypothetical protein [Streptomyces heilongjiangensis]MDC2946940.1 hypothetical protein [Streptomyces heilongjiangensis]